MSVLHYRSFVYADALLVDECTIHFAVVAGTEFALLWFHVRRDTDQQPELFCVPVNPGGGYSEALPIGKTWGLTRTASGSWQIAPSINVLTTMEVHPGDHLTPSLWHHTPMIVDVPEEEKWIPAASTRA